MRDELDRAVERIVREADARLLNVHSYSDLMDQLEEVGWSDAARAASIAARRAGSRLRPVFSGSTARRQVSGEAKTLMDQRRKAVQRMRVLGNSPLDQRLKQQLGNRVRSIDRVAGKLAPSVKSPRMAMAKRAAGSAGRFIRRLFVQ